MTIQNSVREKMNVAVAGMIGTSAPLSVHTRVNGSLQKETFTVTSADTTTTVTINGNAYTWTAGTGTTTVIAAAVVVLIEAGETLVSASSDVNVITVISTTVGTAFTSAATANNTKALINHNTSALSFGYFVSVDSDDNDNLKLPAIATDVTGKLAGGFLKFTQTREQTDEGWKINAEANYVRKGEVWAVAEEAMTVGDSVYVRFAADTYSTIGAVRTDVDTASAALLAGVSVLDYDSTTGLVLLDVNLAA